MLRYLEYCNEIKKERELERKQTEAVMKLLYFQFLYFTLFFPFFYFKRQ